ncbi:hypothetical protein ACFQ51_34445 [Streptomyces kaempferi]
MGVPGLGQALARFGPVGQDVTLDDGDVGVRVQGRGGQQAVGPAPMTTARPEPGARSPAAAPRGR